MIIRNILTIKSLFQSVFFVTLVLLLSAKQSVQADDGHHKLVTIAFVGDSMADGLWGAFFRRLGKDKCLAEHIKLLRLAKNGTGLIRAETYNWIAEIDKIADSDKVDVFVASLGINDRQGLLDKDGKRYELGTSLYEAHYGALIEAFAQNVVAHGASLLLLGLPVMRDQAVQEDAKNKNKLFEAAMTKLGLPHAKFIKAWEDSNNPQEYKPFLSDANNQMVQFRATDGIHFTQSGYDQLMVYFFPTIVSEADSHQQNLLSDCRH